MAYLRKKDTVYFLNGGQPVFSLVEKVAFRRYRSKTVDPKTGKKKMKSMPYAICKIYSSDDSNIPIGAEFLIPGYKLRNITMKGDKILVIHSTYVAEFQEKYGNDWVKKLIEQEK
jgi:hypothetical protein